MRDQKNATVMMDEADSEIELSAQELRELAISTAGCPSKDAAIDSQPTSKNARATTGETFAETKTTQSSGSRHSAIPRVTAAIALAIGTMAAGAALYVAVNSGVEPSSAYASYSPQNEVFGVASADEFDALDVADQPVLFANPFDPTEVFEFPAGTTDAVARDLVAHALLERATQRQLHAMNN